MAHQSNAEVDAAAAAEVATIEHAPAAEQYTTLAYGASGECVTQLVNLLAVLGYDSNDVVKGGPAVLDQSVLADVAATRTALGISQPEVLTAAEIPVGVKGELVDQALWAALYDAAAAKLAPPASASPATTVAVPPAGA